MNHNTRILTRRSLLKSTAVAVAAPYIIPALALGKESRPAPSNRLTMGLIGLGSMGMRHIKGFLHENDCQIVAVCDVDASRRRAALDEVNKHYDNKNCAQYNDFRDMIARDDIDTLCISVPDHWHAIIYITGINAGKDVYGEKPFALTISEGRAVVNAVTQRSCVWQTGSWQRSDSLFSFACELVRNKRIGRLLKVEVGCGLGYSTGPEPVMPIPEGFDYDMWLGPAPWAPFTAKRCHHYKFPHGFRWILDYSGGQVTDGGAHHIDIAQWGLDCDDTGPIEVEGKGIFPEDGLWNTAVDYKFKCTYKNGITLYVGSNNHYKQGIRFTGDQGWVHVTRSRVDANPKSLLKAKFGPGEIHLQSVGNHRQGHRRNFLNCVKNRNTTISPAEVGHRSITIAHLGNIAMLLGRKIRWDPAAEQIIGDDSASRMLSRPMRAPWHI